VLTRIFGVHNLALAEDVVRDAFCRALEVWGIRGMPENSSAWLMATAKNRGARSPAEGTYRTQVRARNSGSFHGAHGHSPHSSRSFLESNAIQDDLLRMMFSCFHPWSPQEARCVSTLHACRCTSMHRKT
jgi:RNA polymerase sigma-70 factor (ECF subfamily)